MSTKHEIEVSLNDAEIRYDILKQSIDALGSSKHMKSRRLSEDARKEVDLIKDLKAQLKMMS